MFNWGAAGRSYSNWKILGGTFGNDGNTHRTLFAGILSIPETNRSRPSRPDPHLGPQDRASE